MFIKHGLELQDAETILAGCKAEAIRMSRAVSIAVTDEAGAPLGMLRLDGASPFTADMALEKGKSAALGRRPTKAFEDTINNGRTSLLTAPTLRALVEGGVPIVHAGHTIGAVGVSGAKSTEDVQIATAGIATLLPAAAQ